MKRKQPRPPQADEEPTEGDERPGWFFDEMSEPGTDEPAAEHGRTAQDAPDADDGSTVEERPARDDGPGDPVAPDRQDLAPPAPAPATGAERPVAGQPGRETAVWDDGSSDDDDDRDRDFGGYAPWEPNDGDRRRRFPLPGRDLVLCAALALTLVLTVLFVVWMQRREVQVFAASPAQPTTLADRAPTELPSVGTYVSSRVTETGDVQVTQWIRSATPVRAVRFTLPSSLDSTPARATGVRVSAGSTVVRPRPIGAAGRRVVLGTASKVVYVRYTLKGAVTRSSSAPGRALALATSMQARYKQRRGPARIDVTGPDVLAVSCRESPATTPRPCGRSFGERWRVVLDNPERDDIVSAQVNLD